MRRTLTEIQDGLTPHLRGDHDFCLLEAQIEKGKIKGRVSGTVVSSQFKKKGAVERWSLVGDWLDEEDIDQALIGPLKLLTPEEYQTTLTG